MAWKPWYERMADFDSAQERDDFIRGVFGPPPLSNKQAAGMVLTAVLAGWGVNKIIKGVRK
jgi:hypothetical protein